VVLSPTEQSEPFEQSVPIHLRREKLPHSNRPLKESSYTMKKRTRKQCLRRRKNCREWNGWRQRLMECEFGKRQTERKEETIKQRKEKWMSRRKSSRILSITSQFHAQTQ